MVDRDIVTSKMDAIKRHLERLNGIARVKRRVFLESADAQDIAVFNLQMAIQKCIDIGNHFFSEWDIGAPSSYGEVFDELRRRKVISRPMADKLIRMVGLRNRIAHEYEDIDHGKIYEFIAKNLGDFNAYLRQIAKQL